MVSAVSSTTFANRKPNLLGSLVMSKVLDSAQQKFGGTTSSAMVNGRGTISGGVSNQPIVISNVTTPTEKSELVIIVGAAPLLTVASNTSKDWLLKRGATTIDTFSLIAGDSNSSEVDLRIYVNPNPVVGTHNYALEEDDADTYGTVTMQLFFIKGTDTHTAEITTPATATKQINSSDSHRTQQTEVIP